MKQKLSLLFLLTIQLLVAQNFQSVEEVNDVCSQLAFASNKEAELTVDKILDFTDESRNFIIVACPNTLNAAAMNIPNSSDIRERYIIYNNDFFKHLKEKTGTEWAAISVLAHEMGHHVKSHALSNRGSNHPFEFEADYYSGKVLAKMGASLEEAQIAMQHFGNDKATPFHPAKADRLLQIEKGWNEGSGFLTEDTKKEIARKRALKLYRKAEKEYTDKNFQEAITHFNKAKDLGNIDAYFYLSSIYYHGMSVDINYFKAYELAKEGYELGSIPATYLYATYLADGFVIKKDDQASERLFKKDFQVKWFKKEYLLNKTPYLATIIGNMNELGYGGVSQDFDTAMLWYKKAANQGDLQGMERLGIFYKYGKIVEKNYKKSMYWLKKSADEDYAVAQNNLALLYDQGKGVEKDEQKAFYWYKKAANQGEALAIYNLGLAYAKGSGVEKNYKEAFYWNTKVANFPGHFRAQNNLGVMYAKGKGTAKDYEEAYYWYRKSAKLDYATAQNNLGKLFKTGQGVEKDVEKAVYWYQKAANQGDDMAQFNLGVMYQNGEHVEQDYKKAIYWYKKSAKQNYAAAQHNLGVIYDDGLGVEENDEKAVYWYKKAAEQEYATSQYWLGIMFAKGYGITQNDDKAIFWLKKAANNGSKKAQKDLTTIGITW